jgi:hypothetical protein
MRTESLEQQWDFNLDTVRPYLTIDASRWWQRRSPTLPAAAVVTNGRSRAY